MSDYGRLGTTPLDEIKKMVLDQLERTKYGMLDKHLKETQDGTKYIVQTPEQFIRTRIGTCWETALYVWDWLDKFYPDIEKEMFYIQVDNDNMGTHMWVCIDVGDGEYYAIEISWQSYRGCIDYSSKEKTLKLYIRRTLLQYKAKDYILLSCNPIIKPDRDAEMFMTDIFKNSKIVTGKGLIMKAYAKMDLEYLLGYTQKEQAAIGVAVNESSVTSEADKAAVIAILDSLDEDERKFIEHNGGYKLETPSLIWRMVLRNRGRVKPLIGFVDLYRHGKESAVITYAIHKDYHGEHEGDYLVERAIEEMDNLGLTTIIAGCDAENYKSARLLQRHGFIMTKKTKNHMQFSYTSKKGIEKLKEQILSVSGKQSFSEAYAEPNLTHIEWVTSKQGHLNPVLMMDGKRYRVRMETLIFKDGMVFAQPRPGTTVKFPGGGIEKGKSIVDQAKRECQEEARINVVNIEYTGCTHTMLYNHPEGWLDKAGLNYDGCFTFVYVADYGSEYKGDVAEMDYDDLYLKGDWYDPDKLDLNAAQMKAVDYHDGLDDDLEDEIDQMTESVMSEVNVPVSGMERDLAFVTVYGPKEEQERQKRTLVEGYAISNDVLTKNIITVDPEDSVLKKVSSDFLNGRSVRIFQCHTNKLNHIVNLVNRGGMILPHGFIYEEVSGKQVLCDDQILCDPVFEEVNPVEIIGRMGSDIQTIGEEFKATQDQLGEEFVINSPRLMRQATKVLEGTTDVCIFENQHGFYARHVKTNKRTAYFKKIKDVPARVVSS